MPKAKLGKLGTVVVDHDELMDIGASLSRSQAMKLEQELKGESTSLEYRLQLLGYYKRCFHVISRSRYANSYADCLCWIIDNCPTSQVLEDCTILEDSAPFRRVKQHWQIAAEKNPGDKRVLKNLAESCSAAWPKFAEKYRRLSVEEDDAVIEQLITQAKAAQDKAIDPKRKADCVAAGKCLSIAKEVMDLLKVGSEKLSKEMRIDSELLLSSSAVVAMKFDLLDDAKALAEFFINHYGPRNARIFAVASAQSGQTRKMQRRNSLPNRALTNKLGNGRVE